MATRRDIRESFYTELEAAVNGLVDPSNVSQENPNSKEDLPAVVHNDNYRKVPMNRGNAPTSVDTDGSGNDTAHNYSSMMQARFDITVLSDDESLKEDIYEAVRSYFEPFTHFEDPSQIQSDVHRVEVQDATSNDLTDRDPTARGDTLAVNLGFERTYTEAVTAVEEVDRSVDGDNSTTT
jgi:hypothetical protein